MVKTIGALNHYLCMDTWSLQE